MMPDVRTTLVDIQRRVVEHYKHLLRQDMSDPERDLIREKLAREESVLSELLGYRMAA
jgi:hypothetical protein